MRSSGPIERLRKGCGPSWQQLTTRDVERLHWALGELWTYLPHSEWEDLRFTSQGQAGVTELLAIGAELARATRPPAELDRMAEQLRPVQADAGQTRVVRPAKGDALKTPRPGMRSSHPGPRCLRRALAPAP